MHDPTETCQARPPESRGLMAHPVRVLVVDDYPDNVTSLALLLRWYHHEVDTAYSGPDAIRLAEAHRPDVALLDISMPEMDGYEVARHLRAIFQDRVILIALTANGSDDDRQRVIDAGFDMHLIKPADPVALESLLQTLAR